MLAMSATTAPTMKSPSSSISAMATKATATAGRELLKGMPGKGATMSSPPAAITSPAS